MQRNGLLSGYFYLKKKSQKFRNTRVVFDGWMGNNLYISSVLRRPSQVIYIYNVCHLKNYIRVYD